MNIGLWEVNLPQFSQNVGGYFDRLGSLKENIKLGKRAQKNLKELKNLQLKPLIIKRSENKNEIKGKEYFLEVIHITSKRKKKGIIVNKIWNASGIEHKNKEELPYKIFKEKLKVEKQDILFFKWIKSLSIELDFPLQQTLLTDRVSDSNIGLRWFDIPVIKRGSSRKKLSPPKLRLMSSVLEARYNKLYDEKLNFCVIFSDNPLTEWAPKILEQTYSRYLLQLTSAEKPPHYKSKRCKYNFKGNAQNWIVEFSGSYQELDIFGRSYDALFDTHFNKLEFFKVRAKKLKYNKPIKKKTYRTWRLEKEDLKDMVWDPLKRISCNNSWNTIYGHDNISEEVYYIMPIKLKFQELDSGSLDLIDNQKKTFGTIKLAMRISNVKAVENTSFEECEENETTSNEIREVGHDDGFSSGQDINTSLAPQKRSFIDSELMSLLATKKKVKRSEQIGGKSVSSTSYLMNSGTYANQDKTPVSESAYIEKNDLSFNSSSIRHSLLEEHIKNKCVAVNANKMVENQKAIQFLCKNSQLDLIEQPYFGECDFIISHSTCLYKIYANQFLQLRHNGSLHYDKAINDLLTEFQRVIIVVEFPEILQEVDPDLFWKIRFYLLHSRTNVFFIHDDTNLFIDWIQYFIAKWAHSYSEAKEENIANADILLDLGFNILLIRKIFQTYSLKGFFMAIIKEESQAVKLLTVSQMNRLKKLLTLEW